MGDRGTLCDVIPVFSACEQSLLLTARILLPQTAAAQAEPVLAESVTSLLGWRKGLGDVRLKPCG
jgi:hypothetical protein